MDPALVHPHGDEQAAARAALAFVDIVSVSLRLGGTVTGARRRALEAGQLIRELDPVARQLHASVEIALDPFGILNPGKVLPIEP